MGMKSSDLGTGLKDSSDTLRRRRWYSTTS